MDADFPQDVNRSTDLYTDEGAYTSAAHELSTSGRWYRPNEFNSVINQPVGHLLHHLVFTVFGSSLVSARLTILFCFVQILFLIYILTKRYASETTAFVVVGLLATNFFLFAFSRLAILELMMAYFCVLALASVLLAPDITYRTVILASLCLALATLTKYTGIVAIAPVLYIIWARTQSTPLANRLAKIATTAVVCLALVLIYLAWAKTQYPIDFQNYQMAVTQRSETNLRQLLTNPYTTLYVAARNDLMLAIYAFFLIPLALLKVPTFRNSLWVQALCVWFAASFLFLCISNYLPARYFILFTLIMVALVGLALAHLAQAMKPQAWRIAVSLLLVPMLGINLYWTATYLLHPQFTFIKMARDVTTLVQQDAPNESPRIIGNFAATISLATGIPYVNLVFTNVPLAVRIENYPPTHYVAFGDDVDAAKKLQEWYRLEYLQSWDVFQNYNKGNAVHLYKLIPKLDR